MMISIFLGLSVANVLLLVMTAGLGLVIPNVTATPYSDFYASHVIIGIAAGLLTTLTHTVIYVYFMATSKWLQAATDKMAAEPKHFAIPSLTNKSRILRTIVAPITATMLTLFAGAAADPTTSAWLPMGIHLLLGITTIFTNLIAAVLQFPLINQQGQLMDRALAVLNSSAPIIGPNTSKAVVSHSLEAIVCNPK